MVEYNSKVSSLFDSIKISDLIPNKQDVKYVAHNSTIQQALKILSENKIRSLPVIKDKECVGIINSLDIAGFISESSPKQDQFKQNAQKIFSTEIQQVLNFKSDTFVPMHSSFNVKLAIQAFCNIAHSLPVTGDSKNGEITNILTQSDIVRYIASDVDLYLAKYSNESLSSLHMIKGENSIENVSIGEKTVDALRLLYKKKINAVAVIDQVGRLVGNLSASDLTVLNADNFENIYQQISSFLPKKQELITCSSDEHLGSVIKLLTSKTVHRVWVVDDKKKPIGLVTLSDVIKTLHTIISPKNH